MFLLLSSPACVLTFSFLRILTSISSFLPSCYLLLPSDLIFSPIHDGTTPAVPYRPHAPIALSELPATPLSIF